MDKAVNMDNCSQKQPESGAIGAERKPYHSPKLQALGSIQSLVHQQFTTGADGGGDGDNHS